jgi:hypothetical protein
VVKTIGMKDVRLIATADAYVDAFHQGSASWRDWYAISSILLGEQRNPIGEAEPDAE